MVNFQKHPKPLLPAHMYPIHMWQGKKAKCNYYISSMYSSFEIWHQNVLVKKGLRLCIKIIVTTLFCISPPFNSKRSACNSIHKPSAARAFYKPT